MRAGGLALDEVDGGLSDPEGDRWVQVHLVRVARDVGGPSAVKCLARHAGHEDREVGLAVLLALGTLVSAAVQEGWAHEDVDASQVVLADLEHATRTLRAIVACEPHPAAHGLRAALRDELDLLQRRVLAGLAADHGQEPLARVSFQLAKGDARSHALAVEWLDVTLTGTDRAAVPLIEPGLSEVERLRRLTRALPIPDRSVADVLHDLITDPEDRWREPWVRACALHAAWSLPELGIDRSVLAEWIDGFERAGAPAIVDETIAAIRDRAERGAVDAPARMASSSVHRPGGVGVVTGRGGPPGGG